MSTTKAVVLGLMSKMPVAGMVWLTVPYLLGLERLGYDVYYVEAHARTPTTLMRSAEDDSGTLAAGFIESVMRRFDLGDRWAYHALHADGRVYGMSHPELMELYRSAAVIFNLHGGTSPLAEHRAHDRLILIETDPVQLELELHDGSAEAREFVEAHAAVFTWAQNLGRPDCRVPLPGYTFRPTRMPILLDEWRTDAGPSRPFFTTIGNWEQRWRDVTFEGERYGWSKDEEFAKVIDLPRRTTQEFELALASLPADSRALLLGNGWRVRDADSVSGDVDTYRSYVQASRGEFTVAKDQNVRLRSGWFSDRSAAYLAAGRPVVTQDTGFGSALPIGEGLHAFSTVDEAFAAVEAVNSDYRRHARAAADIAAEYFDAGSVLREMLTEIGLPAFPPSLSLAVSRAPTSLSPEATAAIESLPRPKRPRARAQDPVVAIVVVTHDGLAFTRLCIETILGDPLLPDFELVVVDNASADGTREYLHNLAAWDERLLVVEHTDNQGFPQAVNDAVARTHAPRILLLNNDTIAPPGSLRRLLAHLDRDPHLGLIGAVTNRGGGGRAQIDAPYSTLDELYSFAEQRGRERAGQTTELSMVTMFCVALRRATWHRLGPLEERFGLGLFEDDDYSERARSAGLTIACAEDAFVHHFGEATFGRMVATGEYAALFASNRERFEEKWGHPWEEREPRHHDGYAPLVDRVRTVIEETVPAGARVLVISKGDGALIGIDAVAASHFPQTADGGYAGHYPADGEAALRDLDALNAEFLVVPEPSGWWLDHYAELRERLDGRCIHEDDACAVYALGGRA